MSEQEDLTLSDTFDKCMDLLEILENTDLTTASDEYQTLIKNGIQKLESATHMVNLLSLFSSNETIDEVSTSNLKYFLLPALLGFFNEKLQSQGPSVRLERLQLVELYYHDFLERCRNYNLPNTKVPEMNEEEEEHNAKRDSASSLRSLELERQEKIDNFKKMKEVEAKLKEYKIAIRSHDEEIVRDYFLLLLKSWVLRIVDEFNAMRMEKKILQAMATKMAAPKKGGKKPEPERLKPVIIVKSELQKKVYGLGYPSVPVLTVDEFYKQRYPESEQNNTTAAQLSSLQQMAIDPDAAKKAIEAEDEQIENDIERDVVMALAKARAFDDWKDENPRGAGNRKNMG